MFPPLGLSFPYLYLITLFKKVVWCIMKKLYLLDLTKLFCLLPTSCIIATSVGSPDFTYSYS